MTNDLNAAAAAAKLNARLVAIGDILRRRGYATAIRPSYLRLVEPWRGHDVLIARDGDKIRVSFYDVRADGNLVASFLIDDRQFLTDADVTAFLITFLHVVIVGDPNA